LLVDLLVVERWRFHIEIIHACDDKALDCIDDTIRPKYSDEKKSLELIVIGLLGVTTWKLSGLFWSF
jgi:hypothetical protein